MALSRRECGVFTHDTFTIDMIHHSARIGDPPVTGAQLQRLMRAVFDADVIDPEPLASLRMRLLRQEIDSNPNGNPFGNGSMLEEFFHVDHQSSDLLRRGKGLNARFRRRIPIVPGIAQLPLI